MARACRRARAAALSVRDLLVQCDDADEPSLAIPAWEVAPGERVGVTGPNGSGKSTLADTLFGLRPPRGGSVRLDGVDLRDVPLSALRRHVALVRDIELFPGTVIDNVRLGRDDMTHTDVRDALAAVGLLDELLELPDGLDTELHPHGRPLSYRQASRLMIARAIAGRPRLIVLDGALDQIDRHDEQEQLGQALFGPAAPWTVICITERADLLARCTRVVTVADGDVHEEDES